MKRKLGTYILSYVTIDKSGFGAEEHEQSHPYRKMCRTLRQFLLV